MRQPPWPQQGADLDDQETVFSDQGSVTPPTLPRGDQAPAPGFVRATPAAGTTPQPYQPQAPFGAPAYQEPTAAPAQTMLISERPVPVFAWLVVFDGPTKGEIGTVHVLHPGSTSIGRVPGNQIVIHDETCSAQHARIRIEAREDKESAFVLYDMGSSNGTFVGDRETYKDEENLKYRHELQDGDYLLVGETTLVFKRL
jgi:hypothetical protein